MVKIVALSTICADIFVETNEIRLGGEALNFAMTIADDPHVSVSLMGAIGNDEIGSKALQCIKQRKAIDMSCVHVIENGKTASNRIFLDAGGNRYFKPDSWDGGVYQTFRLADMDREKLREAEIVFINYSSVNFPEVFALKSKFGYQLAVDFDVARNFEEIEELIGQIDYFFISGDEQTLAVLKEWSTLYDGIFNATLAEEGSVTFYQGKEYRVEAVPVGKIVDTTGCGDSYHAAFIASYGKERDIRAAMEEGSLAAAKTLAFLGGFEGADC